MYCAMIGDVVGSGVIAPPERKRLQETLARELEIINHDFHLHIISPFTLTLGDEFQGLLHDAASFLEIAERLEFAVYPHVLYFGVGLGEVYTEINRSWAIATDGPAYSRAREALDQAKKHPRNKFPIFLKILENDAPDEALLGVALGTLREIFSGWTDKQREAARGELFFKLTLHERAAELGISESALSRRLAAAKTDTYCDTRKILTEYLRRQYDFAPGDPLREAAACRSRGKYYEEEEWNYDRALMEYGAAWKFFGDSSVETPDAADIAGCIAGILKKQGGYPEALKWYRKALAIKEKAFGKEHPDTAASYNDIASVYGNQGKYDDALEWHRKALSIREKALGKEHPDTATTYNNIALVYSDQGKYEEALEWHRKALAIREKALGKEHPDTATTYNNIALVYYRQGKYDDALEWHRKDLAINKKVLGKEHPATATTYNNIANVYSDQGKYEEALEWYRKDLAICEKALGKEHPNTAITYNNIASVYRRQGKYDNALEWHRKALAIREKALGKEHPDTLWTMNSLAEVFEELGQPEKALPLYKALAQTKGGAP